MSRYYFPDLVRDDPYRALDWRWQRAQELLADGKHISRRRDDDVTCQALDFLRQADHRTHRRRTRWTPGTHVIRDAIQLRDGPPERVHEIHARILARQSVEEIGRRVSVPGTVIAMYESLHFNVLDKINAGDWIRSQAIGCPQHPDKWVILKAWAYHGGFQVLDFVLPQILSYPGWVGATADVSTADDQIVLRIRRAIVLDMLPFDQKTSWQVVRLHLEMLSRKPDQPKQSPLHETIGAIASDLVSETARVTPQSPDACRTSA